MQFTRGKIGILIVCLIAATLIVGARMMRHDGQAATVVPAPVTHLAPVAGGIPIDYSHMTMAQLLKELADKSDPMMMMFGGEDQQAQIYKSEVSMAGSIGLRIDLEARYADALLNGGRSEDAIAQYKLMDRQIAKNFPAQAAQSHAVLLMDEAIGYLRLGEQQNCCANNNSDSCLIPIKGSGIHTRQYGAQHALDALNELLRANPNDVKARWLLNITYMTLGEYPDRVPKQYLIDRKVYGAEGNMKPFFNAAPQLGLNVSNNAGGAALEDFEGNGNLDVMISQTYRYGQLRYFRNNGDGTFTDRTKEAGLIGEIGGLNFITTDYNNDGRPDVLVLRGGWQHQVGHLPASLLRNDGNGHFTDVTMQSGLIGHMSPTQTAVWFDYNGDGWLDLFIGNESAPDDSSPCELWRNNRDGTFTNIAHEAGVDLVRYVKAAVAADYDHDGRPDLYISCQDGKNLLLHNDGPAGPDKSLTAPWKFTDVAHRAGVDHQSHTFSCMFFDYDNDGWPDLYVGGYGVKDVADIAKDYLGQPNGGERARLYHNNHDGTFADVTKQVGLYKVVQGMGVNFGDLDNDGWPDFYVGTGNPDLTMLIPKRMFHSVGGKRFEEVTITGNFGHLQKGHGIAFGDINNNGQEDIFAEMGGAYTGDTAHDCLYVNPGNNNKWVTISTEGVQSNRMGLGAEICVTVETPKGERNVYQTVGSGGSFGCNPFRQHFGLGDATAIKKALIHWPASGITQTVTGLQMDQFYTIREGDSTARMQHLKTFPLPHESAVGAMMAKAMNMTAPVIVN